MNWGGPEFVLAIVAIATFGGVMKAALRARYGQPVDDERPRRHRSGKRSREEIDTLRSENLRLTERVEAYEDRIAVLERIVTDSSYTLSHEIERLRDEPVRLNDKGNVQ